MSILEKVYAGISRIPYIHQKECVLRYEHTLDAMLLWEVGTGKSGGALSIARMRMIQENRFLKTLIISPAVTLGNWQNEISIWTPIKSTSVHAMITGSGAKKAQYVREKLIPANTGNVLIVNYEALLCEELFRAIAEWAPEIIIFDEIHRCKSHKSQRSKLCAILADKAKYKITLTGSPILNSVLDIFMPFRIMDRGETFGTNIHIFQTRYMVDENAGWKASGRHGYFPKWVNNEKTFPELTQKIYRKAMRKLKSECLDLPPLIEQTILFPMGKEQAKAYAEMKRDFLTYVENKKKEGEVVTAKLALTKAMKLMQIASGFVTTDDGNVIEFKENPKMDYLEEKLLELTPSHKVIIWVSFVHNYRMIERLLKKLGINYVMLTGEESTKEKNENQKTFQEDPACRVALCNRKAGGIGINLTEATYSYVFSRNFSLEEEIQSTGRNHRGGSEKWNQILKTDLAMKSTIEEIALAALLNKQQISNEVIDLIKQEK